MKYKHIEIYSDGGCSGNPGPGGWAFTFSADGVFEKEASGGTAATTNNRMELTAVIEALKAALPYEPEKVVVHTDSQYVKNGITLWVNNWKRNGWRTASKAPVKNKELWVVLDELNSKLPVEWKWVKGHAGIEGNERCDAMVRIEMDKFL